MRLNVRLGRLLLRALPEEKPVPLQRVRRLRQLSLGVDSLFPSNGGETSTGRELRNPFLAELLARYEINPWMLETYTLNFLESAIQASPPRAVLEFGSGLSTVCLARYMTERHPQRASNDIPLVISLDQSAESAKSTEQFLTKSGLQDCVRVFHAPLEPRAIHDQIMNCYSIPEEAAAIIAKARPDFVVIDGPLAEPGARFGTLPLVRSYLAPGTRFYLDDALRDGEINAALLWTRFLKGISIEGILPRGKGLLIGCID